MSASGPDQTKANAASDAARHRGVVGRIRRWQWLSAAAGLLIWWLAAGPGEALSFGVGALASILSFGLLDHFTSAFTGGVPARRASRAGMVLSVFRIVLIGGLLFVIMSNYSLHPLAAGTGLLTTVAAITIEALVGSLLCMNLG